MAGCGPEAVIRRLQPVCLIRPSPTTFDSASRTPDPGQSVWCRRFWFWGLWRLFPTFSNIEIYCELITDSDNYGLVGIARKRVFLGPVLSPPVLRFGVRVLFIDSFAVGTGARGAAFLADFGRQFSHSLLNEVCVIGVRRKPIHARYNVLGNVFDLSAFLAVAHVVFSVQMTGCSMF